jgi:hypothetical protein
MPINKTTGRAILASALLVAVLGAVIWFCVRGRSPAQSASTDVPPNELLGSWVREENGGPMGQKKTTRLTLTADGEVRREIVLSRPGFETRVLTKSKIVHAEPGSFATIMYSKLDGGESGKETIKPADKDTRAYHYELIEDNNALRLTLVNTPSSTMIFQKIP